MSFNEEYFGKWASLNRIKKILNIYYLGDQYNSDQGARKLYSNTDEQGKESPKQKDKVVGPRTFKKEHASLVFSKLSDFTADVIENSLPDLMKNSGRVTIKDSDPKKGEKVHKDMENAITMTVRNSKDPFFKIKKVMEELKKRLPHEEHCKVISTKATSKRDLQGCRIFYNLNSKIGAFERISPYSLRVLSVVIESMLLSIDLDILLTMPLSDTPIHKQKKRKRSKVGASKEKKKSPVSKRRKSNPETGM